MRKRWIAIGAAAVVVVAVAVILRQRPAAETGVPNDTRAPDRQRLADFWTMFREANRLRLHGNFESAVNVYQRCLKLKPGHEESLYYLGASLEQAGEDAQAAAVFEELIKRNPASERAISQLAGIFSARRPGAPSDPDRARRLYQRVIDLNREQAGPFLRLGLLELDQRDYSPALRNFRIVSRFGTLEGDYRAGYTLYLEGNRKAATAFFQRAIDVLTESRKPSRAGMVSKGGLLPEPGRPLSAAESAVLKSELYLKWMRTAASGAPAAGKFVPAASSIGVKPGGRAAWGDYDSDGELDLLVTRGRGPITLYHHQGRRFTDVTDSAGLRNIRNVWDAVWTDFDGDQRLDLYLLGGGLLGRGENRLYHNLGGGRFADVTNSAGLSGKRATARAIFFDCNRDGHTDLLEVGPQTSGNDAVRLFENERGRWSDITAGAGLKTAGTVVDAAVADYNRDGAPDIFILRWRKAARLFINDGAGRFTDATVKAGLRDIQGDGLSVVAFDYDRDGLPDLLISDQAPFEDVARSLLQPGFSPPHSALRLFRNTGNGRFREVTDAAGLRRSYGVVQAVTADFDADGWEDILVANGSLDARRLEPSVILRNRRGAGFEEWARVPGRSRPGNAIGASIGDYNEDGLPDLYLAGNPLIPPRCRGAGLFRNAANP